jgi:X-X-X-Leu-X-X-Gly heptad repeat protein
MTTEYLATIANPGLTSDDASSDTSYYTSTNPIYADKKDEEPLYKSAGKWVAMGLPLATASALTGLYNTIPLIGNQFSPNTYEYLRTISLAEGMDRVGDFGTSMADYYKEHATGIELGGAVLGSIAPGVLAVKGLQATTRLGVAAFSSAGTGSVGGVVGQSVTAANNVGVVSRTAAVFNNLNPTQARNNILVSAYDKLLTGKNSYTTIFSPERVGVLATTAAKWAAEGAAFEAVSVATQLMNPTYSDINSVRDFLGQVASAGVVGGAIGSIVGAAGFKSIKFLSDGQQTTLRAEANRIGKIKTTIGEVADFGYAIDSIPAGSKLALLYDDAAKGIEYYNKEIEPHLAGLSPEFANKIKEQGKVWYANRDKFLDNIMSNELLNIAEPKTDIGKSIQQLIQKTGKTGDAVKDSEDRRELITVLDGMVSANKITADSLIGNGSMTVQAELTTKAIMNSSAYKRMKQNAKDRTNIEEKIEALGVRVRDLPNDAKSAFGLNIPSGTSPELTNLFTRYRQVKSATAADDLIQQALSDPASVTAEMLRAMGVGDKTRQSVLQAQEFSMQKRNTFFFDLEQGKIIETPAIKLGDYINRGSASKIEPMLTGAIRADGIDILEGVNRVILGMDKPDLLTSQAAWAFTGKFIEKDMLPVKYLNKDNPYQLAEAIRQTLAVGEDIIDFGSKVGKYDLDVMVALLNKEKTKMYKHAINKLDMDEHSAAYFADVPLGFNPKQPKHFEVVDSNGVKVLDGHDFLARRNIEVKYNAETPLNDFQLKSISAIRSLVNTANDQAANETAALLVKLSPSFANKQSFAIADDLRKADLPNAEVNYPDRANAGLLTNATSRIMTLASKVLVMASKTSQMLDTIKRETANTISSPAQLILNSPSKIDDLNYLAVLHRKIQSADRPYIVLSQTNDEVKAIAAQLNMKGNELISSDLWGKLKKAADAPTPETITEAQMLFGDTLHVVPVENMNAHNLIGAYSSRESLLRETKIGLMAARGVSATAHIKGQLYFPPIDKSKTPFFLYVVDETNVALGGFTSTSMIHATTAEKLLAKKEEILKAFPDMKIFDRAALEADKKLMGEFDYNQAFSAYTLDTTLRRKGIMSEFNLRDGQDIMTEMLGHLDKSALGTVRAAVKNMTGDFSYNLDRLARAADPLEASRYGSVSSKAGVATGVRPPDNVYSQMNRNLMLAGPDEFTEGFIGSFIGTQKTIATYMDTAFSKIRDWKIEFGQSSANPAKQAKINEKIDAELDTLVKNAIDLGVDVPQMTGAITGATIEQLRPLYNKSKLPLNDSQFIAGTVRTINSAAVSLTLGLDMANAVLQSISLPITINASLKAALVDAPDNVKNALTGATLPMTVAKHAATVTKEYWSSLPSIANAEKVLYSKPGAKITTEMQNKLAEFSNTPEGKFYLEMQGKGLMSSGDRQVMTEINALSDMSNLSPSTFREKQDAVVKFLSTPTRVSENFTRYASLRFADKVAEAAGIVGANRDSFILTFANQSTGVMIASQRPALFQGFLGSALGLYKSYSLNMMQSLGRHIEDGNVRTLASLAAVQGTLFGAQSIPGMAYINSYIHKQNKETNRDLFQTSNELLGDDVGNNFMYGLPSMFLHTGLYSRGDLNPRSVYGPIGNPFSLDAYPAFNQFGQAFSTVMNGVDNAANGAPVLAAGLNALAHQSLSRPIARLSELMLGAQTTSQGNIVQPIDPAKYMGMGILIRAAGARTADEAIAADLYYRETQYKRDDTLARQKLGNTIKLTVQQGGEVDIDSALNSYVKAGGDVKGFRKWYLDTIRKADDNQIDKLKKSLKNSTLANHFQQIE